MGMLFTFYSRGLQQRHEVRGDWRHHQEIAEATFVYDHQHDQHFSVKIYTVGVESSLNAT